MKFIVFLFIFISCAHNKVDIESYPSKTTISLIESNGQVKEIGQTPLIIDLDKLFQDEKLIKLNFSKDGHKDQVVYLNKPQIKSRISISANLEKNNSASEIISNEKMQELSSKVAEAQKYSFKKNYRKAEKILLDVIEDYPNISVPYDLIANIYYLSNESEKALYFYKKAKNLNPGNAQRDYIITKLKNLTRDIAGE